MIQTDKLMAANDFLAGFATGTLFEGLINRPEPHPFQLPPRVLYESNTTDANRARYTIVMPVFEQAAHLKRNLSLIEENARVLHDWVLIDDGSSDESSAIALEFLTHSTSSLICSRLLLRNDVPIYETACDNLGFAIARTAFVIEIQADIQVMEKNFDGAILETFDLFPTASSISGRAGHSFKIEPQGFVRRALGLRAKHAIGLIGDLVEDPLIIPALRGYVYECETVNRGPWALRKSDLVRHGFLDQANFFLGNDDHDFHRRLYMSEGRRPLYLPMLVKSTLVEGATRRPREALNAKVYEFLKTHKKGSAEFRAFMSEHRRGFPIRRFKRVGR